MNCAAPWSLHNHQLEKILQRQRELYLEIDKRIEAVMAQPASLPRSAPAYTALIQVDNTYVPQVWRRRE